MAPAGARAVVLTIHKIGIAVGDRRAALGAAKYYLDSAESPESFRAEGEGEVGSPGPRAKSVWLGSEEALAALGVERGTAVEVDDLALVLEGRHAKSGAQVRRAGAAKVPLLDAEGRPVLDDAGEECSVTELRVNSVDLPFQAPKSVSVVWSQADPELRAAIEQAMLTAANATLDYMVRTKPVVGGEDPGHGFAAAATLHVTARTAEGETVPSPHLHVHGVLVAVADDKGRLRTPDTRAFYKNGAMLAGGALGRAVLAEELRKLGFGIDSGTGRKGRFFEIHGVPGGLIAAMSTRARDVRREIGQIEAARGRAMGGRERAVVALKTRAPKQRGLLGRKVREAWDALAQEFGFGPASLTGLREASEPTMGLEELRAEARETILRRIWDQGPTVPAGMVETVAYEVATIGLARQQVDDLIVDMRRSGELITLEGGRVTTDQIRSLEQRVMAVATEAASRPPRPVSRLAYERGVAVAQASLGGKGLGEEQLEAVGILTSGRDWGLLTGRAGTGKGPVLEAVAEAHRADGWSVIACAVDGSTAQRLGHQVGAEAMTIDQVVERVRLGILRVDYRTLIVVEEASKAGAWHWGQLAGLIKRGGARLCAVGHNGQIGAIELPGLFASMLKSGAITAKKTLEKIRRHRHRWMVEFQTALDEGRTETAVDTLRQNGALTIHDTRVQAIEALVDGWDERRRLYDDVRDAIMVVLGTNEDVDAVNMRAQGRRRGELSRESVAAVDRDYRIHARDVVMVRESSYEPDPSPGARWPKRVENGTMGVVVGVDPERDRMMVRLDEPAGEREVEFDLARLREQHREKAEAPTSDQRVAAVRLAYAFHPFPLQGETAKDVGVLGAQDPWNEHKESAYTALTRQVHRLHVHHDHESLVEGTNEEPEKRLARRWGHSQGREASIEFDPREFEIPLYEETPEPPAWAVDDGAHVVDAGAARPIASAGIDRSRVAVPDPLGRYRDALGERRAAELERAARKLAAEIERLADDSLRAEVARTEPALAVLDSKDARNAARLALRIESDHRAAHELWLETLEAAREFQARAASRTLSRRERRDLIKAAKVQRENAERDKEALDELAETEHQLRRKGRHVDNWVARHGKNAARWVAAQRELAIRRQLAAEAAGMKAARPELGREGPEAEPRTPAPAELVR